MCYLENCVPMELNSHPGPHRIRILLSSALQGHPCLFVFNACNIILLRWLSGRRELHHRHMESPLYLLFFFCSFSFPPCRTLPLCHCLTLFYSCCSSSYSSLCLRPPRLWGQMANTSLPGLTIHVRPADLLLSWPHSHPTQQASPFKQKGKRSTQWPSTWHRASSWFFPSPKSSHTLINSPAWHFLQHCFPHSSRPNLPNRGRKSYFLCLMLCGQHVCLPCGPRLHCSLPTDCCLHCVTAWPHQSPAATVSLLLQGD